MGSYEVTRLGLDIPVLRRNWAWVFSYGLVLSGLGLTAILLPGSATFVIERIVATVLAIAAIATLIETVRARRFGNMVWHILLFSLYTVTAFLLFTNPFAGILTLTLLLAAFFLLQGFFRIFWAMDVRGFPGWGWVLASGLLSLALAVVLMVGWPTTAVWVIGLIVGADLLFAGAVYSSLGLALKRAGL